MNKVSIKKRILLFCLTTIMLVAQVTTAFAADTNKNSAETAFLRVMLMLVNEEGLSGVTEDMIQFSDSEKWKKGEDGYYYYADPLEDGAKVEFMKGLHIPESWAKNDSEKKFRIVINAEVAENMDGTANWSDGTVRKSTSSIEYQTRKFGTRIYETTDLDVEIKEFELDHNGNRVDYKNDKIVMPGEDISKIVEITVHIKADYDNTGEGKREYDDDDDEDDDDNPHSQEVIPIGDKGTEVIPINDTTGNLIPRIFTGDNSMMIPMIGIAVVALIILVLILHKKRK